MPLTISTAARHCRSTAIWLACAVVGFVCSGTAVAAEGLSDATGEGGSGAFAATPRGISLPSPDRGSAPLDCGIGPGSVAGQQLGSSGNIVISASQLPGQTFRPARSGLLAGLEFGLASCNGVDPDASIQLTLSRAGTVIATALVPVTRLATSTCDTIELSAATLGSGFFDFTGQCVSVTEGEALTATLGIVGSTAHCAANRRCTGGARSGLDCKADLECEYSARAGEADALGAPGNEVVNGEPDETADLAFKVFVR